MMRRMTVEECLVLDVFSLARDGHLASGAKGTSHWQRDGQEVASIRWWVDSSELHLSYQASGVQGPCTAYHYEVPLERLAAAVGKERVWFLCPNCGRRVAKLYLPPSGPQYFFCRHCHALSYESRHERLPAWARDLQRLTRLQKEESRVDVDTPRGYRLNRRMEKLENSLERAGVYKMMDAFKILAERPPGPPRPKRGPGRPSKKEKRAQAQAERTAIQAAHPKRPRGRPKTKRSYTRHTPFVLSERRSDMEAYCVKCRDRREMENPKLVTLPNARPALQGTCPLCQTKVTRIVRASEVEALQAALAYS